ncbi:MAG TPA: SIR2 family protein, partial [Bacteroidia bacterium]|nr:SIR2 family protein [Bacteroidia bacterium]
METNLIPKNLIEQIKSKNTILFLGSGASIGAASTKKIKIPSAQELADAIATEYLGENYIGKPLNYVSELAINERNILEFQSFIYDIFSDFGPAEFHKKIPLFPWNNIFTTNYDLIIEKAYQLCNERVQDLYSLYKNTPQTQIPRGEKTLQYLKLHGCINHINDIDCPLIFTPDQYVTHHNNRERLFARFQELSADYPILFVGHSLSDSDIRFYLQQLESLKSAKPMSYLVAPGITPEEERLWSAKRITCIKLTFKDFLEQLEKSIDVTQRKLASFKIKTELPIFEKFSVNVNDVKPTENLISFINNDIDFVSRDIASQTIDPKSFYKGYFENWDPIIKNLDVKRSISDAILFEVFLEEQEHSSDEFYFYLIKGNAGSGKSVLLRRIAFEASAELSRICIVYRNYVKPSFDEIFELHSFLKERIYIFIDNISSVKSELILLMDKIKKSKLPVTIIGCERINIWNTDCKEIFPYLTEEYHIKYLNDKEITELLILLEKHKALGALEFKTPDERITALREKAGRELLVALYEATSSKPFEEIIYDEYRRISNPVAQSLYLTVSVMHRLGAEARAGLISRVHGISFHEFKEKLFEPLEYIVFDRNNPRLHDFVYLTRHKQVAEMIFTMVLKTPQERFDEYVRIITHLNIDYASDKIAFFSMTNGKQLANLFPDPLMARNFYDIAIKSNPNEKMLYQHRAIYEMNVPGGNLVLAERYLHEAKEPGEVNAIVDHSLAELTLKKADRAKYDNEFSTHIDEVLSLCKALIAKYPSQTHAYHTILKAINMKLERGLNKLDGPSIERILREA